MEQRIKKHQQLLLMSQNYNKQVQFLMTNNDSRLNKKNN